MQDGRADEELERVHVAPGYAVPLVGVMSGDGAITLSPAGAAWMRRYERGEPHDASAPARR